MQEKPRLEKGLELDAPTVSAANINFPAFREQHVELLLAAQVAHVLEAFDFSQAARFLKEQGYTAPPVEGLKRDAKHALEMAVKNGSYHGQFLTAHRHADWLELYVPAFKYDCSEPGPSIDLTVSLYSLVHRTKVLP